MDKQPPTPEPVNETWDDEEEYDDDDDDDLDAEAREIARRLGEQLWADISMANAERNAVTHLDTQSVHPTSAIPNTEHSPESKKEDAILNTMKSILSLIQGDSLARDILSGTIIPGANNVRDILHQSVATGKVDKGIAKSLSQILVALAGSEVLFARLKNPDVAAMHLDIGKRKRDETDEGQHFHQNAYKRLHIPEHDLQNQMFEAIRVISEALGALPPRPLDASSVSAIRLQLHQVFLFSVTSSAVPGSHMHILQEIGGLIQVIGVLSGIQIGQPPSNPIYPWHPGQQAPPMQTDIGTAVYPCLVTGCHKMFSRLYSLRAHQRSHASHRPFRCNLCPASFARNHDLKRHLRLHEKKAWRCEGCTKVFSRRDAIKRHKNVSRNRNPRSEICFAAEIREVQLDGENEDPIREERRAKIWNGIAVNEANSATNASAFNNQTLTAMEDGEVNPLVINAIQSSVIGLHGLLQAQLGNAMGPMSQPLMVAADPASGQTALASVIARAQHQNVPSGGILTPLPTAQPTTGTATDPASSVDVPARGGSLVQGLSFVQNPENLQPLPSLSMYGLSDEQTHLLEIAIASAASAAQAQAEAEAALEEAEEKNEEEEEEEELETNQSK